MMVLSSCVVLLEVCRAGVIDPPIDIEGAAGRIVNVTPLFHHQALFRWSVHQGLPMLNIVVILGHELRSLLA